MEADDENDFEINRQSLPDMPSLWPFRVESEVWHHLCLFLSQRQGLVAAEASTAVHCALFPLPVYSNRNPVMASHTGGPVSYIPTAGSALWCH